LLAFCYTPPSTPSSMSERGKVMHRLSRSSREDSSSV
jgi:hypothetical protein